MAAEPDGARTLWLPDGFEVHELPAGLWRHKAPILVMVSRILTSGRATDRDGFTPIHWRQGRAAFGSHNWNRVRDELERLDVLECDHRAIIAEKAFYYRLGGRWRGQPVCRVRTADPKILRAWLAIRGRTDLGDAEIPVPLDDAVLAHLNRWLRLMTFDEAEVDRGLAAVEDGDRRRYARMIADIVRHGDPDDRDGERCSYGRVHSIVTRMPRWMRSAIRIGGESLIEVDVRGAQPLLQILSAIKQHKRWAGRPGDPHQPAPTTTNTIGAQMSTHAWDRDDLPPDLAECLEAAEKGEFYDWFAEKVGLRTGNRDDAKGAWAWLAYDRQRQDVAVWRERWDRYRLACPWVAHWLETTKKQDYRNAARLMQRYESRLMIRDACGQLALTRPNLPVITIHDAIMTNEAGLDSVCEAIRWAWGREGVCPALKVTRPA